MHSRQHIIESLTSQHAEAAVDAQIALWDHIALQIILLVGETGFDSLYQRSLFLSQSQFPWVGSDAPNTPAEHRFANLKASLQAQPLALAIEANRLLLVTLTDVLASLIGEPLTTRILDSAGDNNAQIEVVKEQTNE